MKNLFPTVIIFLLWVNVRAQSFSDPNFSVSTIVSGLTEPVGVAFSKDAEKLFVWEKAGLLYVCNKSGSSYVKQATPVIDLTAEVLNWRDHGLMGFALDPNFATNGYIYLLYIVDRRFLMNDNSIVADEGHRATIARLTKYRTITSGSNLVADLSTRTILIGESPSTGIPVVHESHVIGSLAFAADGTLLVSTGDGASYYTMDAGSDSDTYWDGAIQDGILRPAENVGAFRSQILNCHNGKLLRVDPNTGNGVSSNPYYSATQPRAPKSRVWAMGFRNAFRMLVKPGTGSTNPATGDIGEVYVGDVGWSTWEEFSIITGAGMNCGWPIYEGHEINSQYNTKAATLQNLDEPNPLSGQSGCTRPYFTFRELIKDPTADENKTINNPCNTSVAIGTGPRYVHRRPAIDFKHEVNSSRVGIFNGNNAALAEIGTPQSGVVGTPFAGNCALAGVWYTGNNFPPEYKNTFLLVDETARWIKRFTIDYTDVITRVDNLVMVFANITTLAENPVDGTLAAVDITNNAVKKIQYGGNQPPVSVPKANVTYGPSPLTVNFTGNTSFDLSPGGSIASWSWNFDGGTPATSTAANPTGIVFTSAGGVPKKFVVRLTVTDNGGATDVDSVIISVNNTPPIVNITSPVKNSTYTLGGDAVYNCTATVTDNEQSGSGLKYEWQSILRHNNHEHPEPIDNNVTTTTRISRIGCNGDTYYWMVRLKVTDAAGLVGIDSSKIFPNCGADNIPPIVTSTTPINGATGVNISTVVTANFSEAIDGTSVTGTTFQLKDAGNNTITATLSTAGSQATLTPTSALSGSTVYTATLKGGATGVKDAAGNTLANDYSWSFTTLAVDNIAPTVTSVVPANGATGISTGTTITANFSEAINSSTVTASTIQLRDAGNNLINSTLNVSGSQVTLTPTALLSGSTVYTATISGGASGVKDLAGNALASNYVWSFTTGAVDNIAPTVSVVSPANGATGISTGTNVTATFSEAINASTVTTSTFQLRNSANTLITATVSTSGNQITLTPSAALANSIVYTATITGGASGVKDLAGNALAGNYSWSFTTTSTPPPSQVSIQSFNTKTGTAATVHSLTSVPAGALLVLSTTADAVTSNCAVSSSPALTWTKRVDAGATNSDNAEIWTAVYAAGGTISVTSSWGAGNSQASVCYVVLNAETTLAGVFNSATLQAAPSVTITTTRVNSIIFCCTADWKAVDGTTRTLRDAATERLYFKDGNFTTYHYTKPAATIASYTEGVSLPSTQSASTSILEIRSNAVAADTPPLVSTHPSSQTKCGGSSVSFSSSANGSPAPTVQWQSSTNGTTWTNITGATTATLSFTVAIADNNKQYRAVWTNTAGNANSNAATLTVNSIPAAPTVNVTNNCGSSFLTATGTSGTLLWSNGATTTSITVSIPGTYSVTQTVNGCTSAPGSNVAAPTAGPATPGVTVQNNCGSSLLTATGTTGSLMWSNGATTPTITVSTGGTYSVTQTVNGCTSAAGSNTAAPKVVPATPNVGVVNNCGNSVLTASGFTGSLLWSTGATTNSITVTTAGSYTVTQTVNGCVSGVGSGTAAPLNSSVDPPVITVDNNCTNSVLTASGYTGSLLWSNGATTPSITVSLPGNYSVTQTVSGCTSPAQVATATPVNSTIPAPVVSVTNNCGNSVLTASGYTGSLLWNTNETTESIIANAAGTYSVTQTIGGCAGVAGSGTAAPKTNPVLSSPLTANASGGAAFTYTATSTTSGTTFAWSRAAVTGIDNAAASGTGNVNETLVNSTGSPVSVIYDYTLTAAGCVNNQNVVVTVSPGGVTVAPNVTTQPVAQTKCAGTNASFISAASGTPSPTVQWQSGNGTTWSNIAGATNATLTFAATTADNGKQYRAVWSNSAGTANSDGAALTVNAIPATPTVGVTNNCGNSVLNATGTTGTLLWSTGATTASITVSTPGSYTVTQALNGCTSLAGSGTAAPKTTPVLSSNLTATATSGTAFTYTATSTTTGTTFAWSRAAVTGISNAAANGTGNINETLVNTTTSPVTVTYVYTLTTSGCPPNTQNVVVTVNPVSVINCVINGSITSTFNSTSIPAGRYIWFSSVFDRGSFSNITGTVTFTITNSVITFTANSQQYTLNVPNSRIRFDAAVTSATTQFVNGVWETVVPRSYSSYVFMGGLAYQVPTNLPGNISNVRWTAKITIDKAGLSLTWRWAAAVYTSFAAHTGLNIKPKNGNTQNPYNNNDNAGTPENFKSSLVSGAKGTGGTNYTGSYSSTSTATCSTAPGQRQVEEPLITKQVTPKKITVLPVDRLDNEELSVSAVPNPSNNIFRLIIKGDNKSYLSVRVTDVFGRIVEHYQKVNANTILQIGQRLSGGSYFVEVLQGNKRRFLKIIKSN